MADRLTPGDQAARLLGRVLEPLQQVATSAGRNHDKSKGIWWYEHLHHQGDDDVPLLVRHVLGDGQQHQHVVALKGGSGVRSRLGKIWTRFKIKASISIISK